MTQERNLEEARTSLLKVFRYLKEFHQLRNPVTREIGKQPWVMWFRDLPAHPAIQRPVAAAPGGDGAGADAQPAGFILKVRRPTLTQAPEPPEAIRPWLKQGWTSPDRPPEVEAQRTEVQPDRTPRVVRFTDDPGREARWQEYQAAHEAWAQAERPARAAMAVFDRLYTMHALLDREAERVELVLGDGLLTWQPAGSERLHHPILLQRLTLSFDPDLPEFTLTETDEPPELYTALLSDVDEVQPAALARSQGDLEQGGWHPLGGEETDGFLRRTVALLAAAGRFQPSAGEPARSGAPVITRDPVLFLRNRSLGFARALEGIIADLQTREEVPAALLRIVGIDSAPEAPATEAGADSAPNGEDEEVLLSKPANPEQLQIAKRLERHGAVLVQGPPGTGKTHTIANLLGHLLAEGKSVLVTSHTAKALTVLRDQVVEPLQPLCVSVLGDNNAQLEAAIDAIGDRLATNNVDDLEREAARLQQERVGLLRRLREARTQLRNARMDEYRSIVIAGTEYTPVAAARHVAAHRATDSWIPSPVIPGEPLPLSEGEVLDLYRTNRSVATAEERELETRLPDPASLLAPSDFAALVAQRREVTAKDLDHRADLWLNPPAGQTREALQNLLKRLQSAAAVIGGAEPWQLEAMAASRSGGAAAQTWTDLVAEIRQVAELAAEAAVVIMRAGPELPTDRPEHELEPVVAAILAHLRKGGKLGGLSLLFKGDWKRLIEGSRVRGARPSSVEEFEALLMAVRLRRARALLTQRWDRQMGPLDAPPSATLGAEPERVAGQFIAEIERSLAWHAKVWEPLAQELSRQGLQWETLLAQVPVKLGRHGELERLKEAATAWLPPILEARAARLQLEQVDAALGELRQRLERVHGAGAAGFSQVVTDLLAAVQGQDPAGYQAAYSRLVTIWNKQGDLSLRRELLQKLEAVAPGWAGAIRARQGVHGEDRPPGDPAAAWLWRQLQDELDRRGRTSLGEIQREISQLTAELHRATASLVEKRAWAGQSRRTTLKQRQALNGWKQLMRRVGKGTGRRAPQFMAEARSLMTDCQSAVPVWIMPLSRVAESFSPARNRFDVVIIDEASQSDMLALVALYLGRQVVVVGDHEQVSPLAIGLEFDRVRQLIEMQLTDIPNRLLYDGQSSVYDLAQTAYEPVCLVEHFRCVTPIIQFSNQLAYHGKIRPLREESRVRRRPATVAYRVDGGSVKAHVNEREAVTIASLLVASAEQPEYARATFGVISLLAEAQARRIDVLLQHVLSPGEYSRRKIRCGGAADFQGDERDVIFLSLVDAPTGRGPLSLRTDGPSQMYKKRYNVAASRARDQMWVIHSLNPGTDLQGADIRLRLIKHAANPSAMEAQIAGATAQSESEFEKQVVTRLIQAGYHVVPQWPVGAYRIDMVVVDGDQRVAVECDGDRWHTAENLQEDITRQAILERMGWRFVRIRGTRFFRDPDGTMAQVLERLGELGVRPVGSAAAEQAPDQGGEALLRRIIRRAAELRRKWCEEEVIDVDPVGEVWRGEVGGGDDAADGVEAGASAGGGGDGLAGGAGAPAGSTAAGGVGTTGRTEASGSAAGDSTSGRTGGVGSPARADGQDESVRRPLVACTIGSYVLVRASDGEEFEFQLVPAGKGNLDEGTISADSPLGRAVKGKVAGERVRVTVPGGIDEYVIVDVRG